MSFFYLSPVKGDMPVHLLETIVIKRLEYLRAILRQDSAVYCEYVLEGSIYDNVGHFMLCVVSILGEYSGVTHFFLKAELELFKKRISSLSPYDMRSFAKKLLRTIRKHENTPPFIEPLQVLCRHLMLKDIAQHICSSTHSNDCAFHSISIHFKHCLPFVARRSVELDNGLAILPCGVWKQYLMHLFTTNLRNRINKSNLSGLKSDPRVMEILMKIKHELPIVIMNTGEHKLTSQTVDVSSRYFPPCMLNLHQYLRKKHRLSHSQRFYYSLFLKDIGMSVGEAIDFWRTEYQQSPNSHSCCHNWQKDEKKFVYGIRHMYGLEGGRKNYTSVNCQRIQNSDTSCSEGGCPFKSFDNQKMIQVLNSQTKMTNTMMSQICELKRKHQYTSACVLYLQKCLESSDCDNVSFNFTPVKYYMLASKSKSMEFEES
ncbi:DNA primase large subunit-like [Pectinophora gossypiella]|uniref:DNA primase large subunit-like n=1 Tax=Pectinophora gossypiella TaxID=13191 RepID=UPI00214F5982|nr:DNA primase large subunit-like [Pectinophora gossypiella]